LPDLEDVEEKELEEEKSQESQMLAGRLLGRLCPCEVLRQSALSALSMR
jgi:hypothetical protein